MTRRFVIGADVLEAFCNVAGESRHKEAVAFVRACYEQGFELCVSVGAVRDVYHALRRRGVSHHDGLRSVASLVRLFSVEDLSVQCVLDALAFEEDDFESALAHALARELKAEAIVTLGDTAISDERVPCISVGACMESFA